MTDDLELPIPKDRYGVLFPDGKWFDQSVGSYLFDQDPAERAIRTAAKAGGIPIRIVTRLERLEPPS